MSSSGASAPSSSFNKRKQKLQQVDPLLLLIKIELAANPVVDSTLRKYLIQLAERRYKARYQLEHLTARLDQLRGEHIKLDKELEIIHDESSKVSSKERTLNNLYSDLANRKSAMDVKYQSLLRDEVKKQQQKLAECSSLMSEIQTRVDVNAKKSVVVQAEKEAVETAIQKILEKFKKQEEREKAGASATEETEDPDLVDYFADNANVVRLSAADVDRFEMAKVEYTAKMKELKIIEEIVIKDRLSSIAAASVLGDDMTALSAMVSAHAQNNTEQRIAQLEKDNKECQEKLVKMEAGIKSSNDLLEPLRQQVDKAKRAGEKFDSLMAALRQTLCDTST